MGLLNVTCRPAALIGVALIWLSGCGSGTGGSVSTTVPTVQVTNNAPDSPASVFAVGGTNKVTLSWGSVSGATAYTIYWSTAAGVTAATGAKIATTGTTYIHRGLLPSATYYYIVTAQNSFGESSASRDVSGVTAGVDGAGPYTAYCANCHGPLAISLVTNATVAEIKAAMQSILSMNALVLTDSQLVEISAALMYNN